jgi:hypothetical protein
LNTLRLGLAAAALAVVSAPAFADPVTVGGPPITWSDNFDDSALSPTGNNTTPFAWTLDSGTVDHLGSTYFGSLCAGSSGCVDMDGSSGVAGAIRSESIVLTDGVQYTLSALIGDNGRNAANGPDQVDFSVLDVTANAIVASGSSGALTFGGAFQLFSTFATSAFTADGTHAYQLLFSSIQPIGGPQGDNEGAILDNVQLNAVAPVPLPASAWLLLSGMLALGVFSRRKQSALAVR